MADLKNIFAKNLKEARRKCGFSQTRLAEMADVSTHYVAMIELAHNFPSAEVIERLAVALNVEMYELFLVSHSLKEDLEHLRQLLVKDIGPLVEGAVENALLKWDRKPVA